MKEKKQRDLREKINGTEKGESEVRITSVGFDGGLMLDDPIREVYSNPFISQEVEAFMSGIGF